MVRLKRYSGLLSTAAGATLLALSAGAAAAEAGYEMSSYVDSPSGRRVLAGDYEGAIDLASLRVAAPKLETRLMESSNLCVAYTLTSDFDAAREACDEAVTLAKRVDARESHLTFRSASETARAMTNRGVLRAVVGDAAGAESDFREAAAMAGLSSAPGRNLAHLESASGRLAMATD